MRSISSRTVSQLCHKNAEGGKQKAAGVLDESAARPLVSALCLLRPYLVLPALLILAGCQWQQPRQKSVWPTDNSRTTVNVSAQKLVEAAQKVIVAEPLSLPVESATDGVILTGWKEYPGELHIVRRWYERTRFRITVTPAFGDAGKSHIAVEDQTEERAAENQPWYPAPQTRRPERGGEVLQQILRHAQQLENTGAK